MHTHREVIGELGGPHRLAVALTAHGLPTKDVTARAWHMRSSIPAKYWAAIVSIAGERQLAVTADVLAAAVADLPTEAA